jgi:hypothetical protein
MTKISYLVDASFSIQSMNHFLSNIFERNFFDHSVWFYITGLSVLLVLLYLVYLVFFKSAYGKQEVSSVVLVENKVISTGEIYNSGGRYGGTSYNTRISVYDAETGAREKWKVFYRDRYSIEMAVNGIIWLEPDDGKSRDKDNRKVLAIDFSSLEKVAGERILKELLKIPLTEQVDIRYEEWEGKVRLKSSHEKYFFECSRLSSPNARPGQTYPYKGGNGKFSFNRMEEVDLYQLFYDNEVVNASGKYYDPTLLAAWDENSKAKAVGYHFEDNHSRVNFLLSMFDRSGNVLWTISGKSLKIKTKNEKRLYPKFIGSNDHILVFRVIQNRTGKIFALDKNTGKLIWEKRG